MGKHLFTFMGTAAGCGVPSFFCDCPACEEARANPRARRGDCGVMVRGIDDDGTVRSTLLIDTPPDTRHQLIRENVRRVDRLLYTHCHSDHVGGLLELEYLVQLKQKAPLPTYGSQECLEGIAGEFHYMTYCLDAHVLQPFEAVEHDGVRYTALPVTHAPGTFGYLVETGGDAAGAGDDADAGDRTSGSPSAEAASGAHGTGTRLFYASDTAKLPPETAERVRGVDVLAMDATFWKRNWSPNDHHSVQECIEEGLSLDVGTLYLTHLCMHYDEPITLAELEEFVAQYGGRVKIAHDGLTFAI